ARICDGSGNCVECISASNCPGADDACSTRTCNGGVCGRSFSSAGTSCGEGKTCDGTGACTGVPNVVINEIESSGGVPGDWVELINAGTGYANVSGWKFLDNDNNHTPYVIPSGTIMAPGQYLVLEE